MPQPALFTTSRRSAARLAVLPLGIGLLALTMFAPSAAALHDEPQAVELTIDAGIARVGGTLLLPHDARPGDTPCVVLVGGTLSQDRDGRCFAPGAPPRDALLRWAEALAAGGYASFRYDPVGRGTSQARPGWDDTYRAQSRTLRAVVAHLRDKGGFSSIVVAGESAGAYVACLAAADGLQPEAWLFLGGFCGPPEELYEYNFGRFVEYVDAHPAARDWAAGLHSERALGRQYRAMFEAARRGDDVFQLADGDFRATFDLRRRREELELRPDDMFERIRRPALVLAGEFDRNVPPAHAARIAERILAGGERRVATAVIPGADHSFQIVPADEHEQIRERFTLASFRRPYAPDVYREAIKWLRRTVPSPHASELGLLAQIAARPAAEPSKAAAQRPAPVPPLPVRAVERTEVDPVTASTPRRVQLAPGVEIIDDVAHPLQTAGVDTLEGRIGPLLLAEGAQAHFIEMPGGMYVEEHPHSTESLIYTVRGHWVLCSRGRRHVMKPGSLFRFGRNVPTGYEVPFDEPAFLLIFKGGRTTRVEQEFIDYLGGMAVRLQQEQQQGTPFTFDALAPDHPARQFAREVNPHWERKRPAPPRADR